MLPVGERIEFDIKSADVVHSFWVPQFLFKRDVMPFPKQNHSDSRFQVSKIEREGAFVGRCAGNVRHVPLDDELRSACGEPADL